MPFSFDFDISALNQFLTSGDVDALLGNDQVTPSPESIPAATTHSTTSFPHPMEAVKNAWFTNMQERDLAREETVIRTAAASTDVSVNDGSDSEGQPGHIDEAWRQKVRTNLVPRIYDMIGPLPSIEFLVDTLDRIYRRTCVLSYIFRNFMLW
jgi:hypothetical protein